MSARRWPIYTMEVGSLFVLERPTLTLRYNLHKRANKRGIILRMNRAEKFNADSPVVVRRVA